MKQTCFATFLLVFFFSVYPLSANAKTVIIETNKVRVRSGAGNYHPVIKKLPKGTTIEVIEEIKGWYKISLPDNQTGFVSIKSIKKRKSKEKMKRLKDDANGVKSVAPSEIMAATKGLTDLGMFAKQYAEKYNVDPAILEKIVTIPFTPSEYSSFKKILISRKKVSVENLSNDPIDQYERDIGAAIALRLSTRGITDNLALRKYTSLIGTAIIENTTFYDEPFFFIVLNSLRAESFAVPGGYIFITTGAVKQCKNEAELAGILAHEIIHVITRHGMKELKKRKTKIKADKMFGSMDETINELGMDTGDTEVYNEMVDMADQMYELLIKGRKQKDEDEADRKGTLFLYNTGYSPFGLKNFLLTVAAKENTPKNSTESHRQPSERAKMIDALINKKSLKNQDSMIFSERFTHNVR